MRMTSAMNMIAVLCFAIACAACSATREVREERLTIREEIEETENGTTTVITTTRELRETQEKLTISPFREGTAQHFGGGPQPGPGPQPIGYRYYYLADYFDDNGNITGSWEFETLSELEAALPDIFFHFFDDHPTPAEIDEIMGWIAEDWIDPATYYHMIN